MLQKVRDFGAAWRAFTTDDMRTLAEHMTVLSKPTGGVMVQQGNVKVLQGIRHLLGKTTARVIQ